jgi:Resolvase, N terminal domain
VTPSAAVDVGSALPCLVSGSFLMSADEGTEDGGVVFCALPTIPAGPVGKFIVQQMAAVAELERGLISQRTNAALAVPRHAARR